MDERTNSRRKILTSIKTSKIIRKKRLMKEPTQGEKA
jgi:hypothetical protein